MLPYQMPLKYEETRDTEFLTNEEPFCEVCIVFIIFNSITQGLSCKANTCLGCPASSCYYKTLCSINVARST